MNDKLLKAKLIGFGIGRRKTSIACVKLYANRNKSKYNILINNKLPEIYFQFNLSNLTKLFLPFKISNTEFGINALITVKGGGLSGQTDAIKLAIVHSLCNLNRNNCNYGMNYLTIESTIHKKFKYYGFLTTNSRIKETKKYGLKKARKASQYSKR